MERLTRWNEETEQAELVAFDDLEWENFKCGLSDVTVDTDISIAIDELAHYEDLEEQGLLLRLPCKVGDTVYVLEEELLEMYEPSSRVYEIEESKFEIWMFEEIGRWVFLTKAEAEKKLAEMGG